MKNTLAIALLLAIALPSFAELTRQDVEQIIRSELEPIKKEITAIKLDIAEMKGKMATKDELTAIRDDTSEMKGKMATKSDIHSLYRWIITMWVTIILAIFGIPYLYGRADREKVKELEARLRED